MKRYEVVYQVVVLVDAADEASVRRLVARLWDGHGKVTVDQVLARELVPVGER